MPALAGGESGVILEEATFGASKAVRLAVLDRFGVARVFSERSADFDTGASRYVFPGVALIVDR